MLNLKGAEPVQLSFEEQKAVLFYRTRQRWSPDGKWLGWPGEFDMFISGASTNTRTIRLVDDSARHSPLAGPPLPPILPPIMRTWPVAGFALTIFAWAPDSQRLVVWNSHSWKTVIYRIDGSVEKEIRPITNSSLADLDWSSAGPIAEIFSGSTGECSISLLAPPFEEASRKRILDFGGTIAGLRFSPQGDALTFVGKKADKWAVYVLDPDTEHLGMVAGGIDGDTSPKWFHGRIPDIADRHLWAFEGCRPRWSPDGKRLVFGSDGHIQVVNQDGTGLKDITPKGVFADGPSWASDGKQIVFHGTTQPSTAGMSRGFSVYIMDADGKNVERLTDGPTHGASDFCPEWKPSGR
jgi:Tol biopolymer transport system component